ncbi:hypothetical protein Y1Q_0015417 [Alligator mississippiensis]|uniref:Uncharacterized protein n=1 Tax=Alligator mississippiensis TaxID=8496 RepID=A0A151NDL4_ALLMI|nr:hypothetical protein Y1Q_0015417 [Alligator mississippiensis]
MQTFTSVRSHVGKPMSCQPIIEFSSRPTGKDQTAVLGGSSKDCIALEDGQITITTRWLHIHCSAALLHAELLDNWDKELAAPLPSLLGAPPGRCLKAIPPPCCHCTPIMSLLHLLQAVHDKLFVQVERYPSHYTLLLLSLLVSHAHLHSWFRILSYDGVGDKPSLPCNLHCHLESFLSQQYMSLPLTAKEEIATRIDTFLGM